MSTTMSLAPCPSCEQHNEWVVIYPGLITRKLEPDGFGAEVLDVEPEEDAFLYAIYECRACGYETDEDPTIGGE